MPWYVIGRLFPDLGILADVRGAGRRCRLNWRGSRRPSQPPRRRSHKLNDLLNRAVPRDTRGANNSFGLTLAEIPSVK